jgi:hypothetical protein
MISYWQHELAEAFALDGPHEGVRRGRSRNLQKIDRRAASRLLVIEADKRTDALAADDLIVS